MLGPLDYFLWLSSLLLELCVVTRAIYKRDFLRYLPLNAYLLCAAASSGGVYLCLHRYGFTSAAYFYYYYCSECTLCILMYFVVISFYQHVLRDMNVSRYVRGGATILLAATAAFSYLVVHEHSDHLTTRFAFELEQNLNFVGVVLIYLLWGAVVKLRETRTRLIQLVLALGVYFSATAGIYAFRNLFPGFELPSLRLIPPVMGTLLPLAWAYTFSAVSEDAQLAPAAIVARAVR